MALMPQALKCTHFEMHTMVKILRIFSAVWGGIGVALFLGYAVYRLLNHFLVIMDYDLTRLQWLALICNVLFMAYTEGYRGFQQGFAPRVAARVLHLSQHATWLNGLLAPAFCLGYFGTTRRRQFTVVIISSMIFALVAVVSHLPQPWRAIVDAGVVVGLLWGLISFIVFLWLAFSRDEFPYSAELSRRWLERAENC